MCVCEEGGKGVGIRTSGAVLESWRFLTFSEKAAKAHLQSAGRSLPRPGCHQTGSPPVMVHHGATEGHRRWPRRNESWNVGLEGVSNYEEAPCREDDGASAGLP